MKEQPPTVTFELEYAGKLVSCKAVMYESHYELFFDGNSIGTIEQNDDWKWIQATGGSISPGTIKEISSRIESFYE